MSIVYLENPNKWLTIKIKKLADLVSQIDDVFKGDWKSDSLWQMLSFFVEEMENMQADVDYDEVEKAYIIYMAYLANDNLADLSDLLKVAIQKSIGQPMNVEARKQVELQNILELKKQAAVDLANRLGWDELEKMMDLYAGIRKDFILISAALLHYQPASSLDFGQLKVAVLGENFAEVKITNWLLVIRGLAQGFFDDDGQVRDLAVGALVNLTAQEDQSDSFAVTMTKVLLLFIAFKDFYSLNKENKVALLNRYSLSATLLGIPWQQNVKEGLRDEPFVEYYVSASEIFAKSILDNREPIAGGSELSLGGFIGEYAAGMSIEQQSDPLKRDQFIAGFTKKNNLPEEVATALKDMLDFYLHLRDCDVVDYKGVLSETGIKPLPFDWKSFVNHDLSEEDLVKAKEFMKTLRRPFSVRSVIIVDFMDVSWREEPYLSRLLALSAIYEEVYGPIYEPLAYFDDKTGQWELNRTRPPRI